MLEYLYSDSDEYKNEIIVGLDEAGAGPLIGDLFIGAIIWHHDKDTGKLKGSDNKLIEKIRDSKKMTKNLKKREELQKFIESNCDYFKVIQVSVDEIDEKNILQARLNGFTRILTEIYKEKKFDRILVDGNQFNTFKLDNGFTIPHCAIEKGDNIFLQIAAASMLAKIYHDNYIRNMIKEYPELEKYSLANHMGYGTAKHIQSIKEYGFTQFHRKSFNPVKTMIENKDGKLNYLIK